MKKKEELENKLRLCSKFGCNKNIINVKLKRGIFKEERLVCPEHGIIEEKFQFIRKRKRRRP